MVAVATSGGKYNKVDFTNLIIDFLSKRYSLPDKVVLKEDILRNRRAGYGKAC